MIDYFEDEVNNYSERIIILIKIESYTTVYIY